MTLEEKLAQSQNMYSKTMIPQLQSLVSSIFQMLRVTTEVAEEYDELLVQCTQLQNILKCHYHSCTPIYRIDDSQLYEDELKQIINDLAEILNS